MPNNKTNSIDDTHLDLIDFEAKGNALFNVKEYHKAMEYYDKILAIDPHHDFALYKKEMSQSHLEEDYQIIEIFSKLLEEDSNDINALNAIAEVYYKIGQIDKALEYTNKVRSIDPEKVITKYSKNWHFEY